MTDLQLETLRLQGQIDALRRELPPEERDRLAAAYSRHDSLARVYGTTPTPPVPGESSVAYRKRALAPYLQYSERFKGAGLTGLDLPGLNAVEDLVFADAQAAARRSESYPPRHLHSVTERIGGRDVTKFYGDPMAWMQSFMTGGQVGTFNRTPKGDR